MLLAAIGFVTICVLALSLSIVSAVWMFAAWSFAGKTEIAPLVLALIAGLLWGLAFELAPFSISLKALG
jgi:uncharacterized protein (DUF486 family)